MIDIVASYNCMQFAGKLMIQTQEIGKKKLILGMMQAPLVQIWAAKFFFKTLVSSVNRYHGQLSSCTIPEKTNDPILRKLSDGKTDGRRDRQKRVISQGTFQLTLSVQQVQRYPTVLKKKPEDYSMKKTFLLQYILCMNMDRRQCTSYVEYSPMSNLFKLNKPLRDVKLLLVP